MPLALSEATECLPASTNIHLLLGLHSLLPLHSMGSLVFCPVRQDLQSAWQSGRKACSKLVENLTDEIRSVMRRMFDIGLWYFSEHKGFQL